MDAARLRRDADIAAVRSEGRRMQHALFALRARPNGMTTMRLAVSAPRALGRAVARNRARRRVREAFRLAIAELAGGNGHDLLVVARASAGEAPFEAIRQAARGTVSSLGSTGAR